MFPLPGNCLALNRGEVQQVAWNVHLPLGEVFCGIMMRFSAVCRKVMKTSKHLQAVGALSASSNSSRRNNGQRRKRNFFPLFAGRGHFLKPHCFAYVLIVHFSELIYVFKKNSDARERHTQSAIHCQKHPERPGKKNFLFLSNSECFGDE
jgi:hypothetical protein